MSHSVMSASWVATRGIARASIRSPTLPLALTRRERTRNVGEIAIHPGCPEPDQPGQREQGGRRQPGYNELHRPVETGPIRLERVIKDDERASHHQSPGQRPATEPAGYQHVSELVHQGDYQDDSDEQQLGHYVRSGRSDLTVGNGRQPEHG
jgi:hypothetical protein